MEQIPTPTIADVILKVRQKQELTAVEELLYLMHVEQLSDNEARMLILRWYSDAGLPN